MPQAKPEKTSEAALPLEVRNVKQDARGDLYGDLPHSADGQPRRVQLHAQGGRKRLQMRAAGFLHTNARMGDQDLWVSAEDARAQAWTVRGRPLRKGGGGGRPRVGTERRMKTSATITPTAARLVQRYADRKGLSFNVAYEELALKGYAREESLAKDRERRREEAAARSTPSV